MKPRYLLEINDSNEKSVYFDSTTFCPYCYLPKPSKQQAWVIENRNLFFADFQDIFFAAYRRAKLFPFCDLLLLVKVIKVDGNDVAQLGLTNRFQNCDCSHAKKMS